MAQMLIVNAVLLAAHAHHSLVQLLRHIHLRASPIRAKGVNTSGAPGALPGIRVTLAAQRVQRITTTALPAAQTNIRVLYL